MDLNALLKSETTLIVVRWAAMILVAGFIARFGKKTADFLIARLKQKRKGSIASEMRTLFS